MTKWTLITGASEGLGVEFAKIAAREGRNLILTARSEAKLNALAAELRDGGTQVVVIPADLNDSAEVHRLWTEASTDREIDVLVNNAGLGRNGPFAQDSDNDADWARELSSMNVNMTALTRLMKLAIAQMQAADGGRILNVASTAAFLPGPNMAVYHATKAFVLYLSEAVAFELRGSGVSVSALCPGATQTNFFNDADMHGIRLLKIAPPARADKVAQIGWDGMLRGKAVIVPGLMNKIFAFMPRLSPRFIVVWLTSIFMSKT
ncbi:MAG: SDR family NAD(P)-dependent oxidoreductase [Sulfitobacter sp.]